ncbi:MAG: FecR family protein [Sphingobium sp.]
MLGLAPDEAAAFWLIRMDSGSFDARAQAEFDAWRSETPGNAAAFERAKNVWKTFEDADSIPDLAALRESALAARPRLRRVIWIAAGAGLAATLVAAVTFDIDNVRSKTTNVRQAAAASTAVHPDLPASMELKRPDQGLFTTAKGERRAVKLADGSTVTLNTDSSIRIALTSQRRVVQLLRGQALFEVAKDHSRPFVVKAADRQVTALGTVFEVRLEPDRMKVTLVEGKVVVDAISDYGKSAAIIPKVLTPGEELVAIIGEPPQLVKVNVEQQLRWRDGFAEFSDVPLGTIVREMNRYSARQIVINDSATANLKVSGIFRTGNPERFAAIIGGLLPVRAASLPDGRIELVSGNDQRSK